jgi:hypothetical protein
MFTWGRERLAYMEEVFPEDPEDEVTGPGLEVNCVAFLAGRFQQQDPQKHLSGGRRPSQKAGGSRHPAILD